MIGEIEENEPILLRDGRFGCVVREPRPRVELGIQVDGEQRIRYVPTSRISRFNVEQKLPYVLPPKSEISTEQGFLRSVWHLNQWTVKGALVEMPLVSEKGSERDSNAAKGGRRRTK